MAGLALLTTLASCPVVAQSFADRLHHDRFDIGGADIDGDGVPNDRDRCPVYTRTGNPPLFEGCNALDLVDRPFNVIDPLRSDFERVRVRVQGLSDNLAIEGMRQVSGDIAAAMNALQMAAFDIAAGNVCTAGAPTGRLGPALMPADDALAELRVRIAERLSELPDTFPDVEFSDHTNEELVIVNMQMAELGLARTRQRTGELSEVYDDLCANHIETVMVEDSIDAFDPAIGRIRMNSGLEVGLTSDFSSFDALYPHVDVGIHGKKVANGLLFAEAMIDIGIGVAPDPLVLHFKCLKLRVVPVQRSPPWFAGPFLHHDPQGYLHSDGRYYLEAGTGFVADSSDCPDHIGGPGSSYPRYSLMLQLDYAHVQHGATSVTLAHDLHSQYSPVYLPHGIAAFPPATLTVISRWQSCFDPGTPLPPNPDDCSEPETLTSTTMTLEIRPRNSFCTLSYEDTVFALEDHELDAFGRTRVNFSGLLAPFSGSVSHTFRAEGYQSPSVGSSSFPVAGSIVGSNYFAIHHQDFFDPDGFFSSEVTGVNKRSGLRWPRLAGTNNGYDFSYSCNLPTIVRDAVTFCSPLPHSYYRFPFSGGYPTWIMGQGNNGAFTHNGAQAFAYDFIADAGTPIRAARGGTVVFVRDDQTGNSFDDPDCGCMANALVIFHQDGSEGAYFHMPVNGVFKSVGAKVKRGDVIASVGNTGFSTTAHLHFQEQVPNSGGITTPSKFQGFTEPFPGSLIPMNCWVPEPGDKLFSNNDP